MLWLGSPGEKELDMLPGNVMGVPPKFHYHPFYYIDWKEEAQIHKQAALRSSIRTTEARRRFYMDFGYMRASTSDYNQPNKATDRVIYSRDGYPSYLLVVDEAMWYIWVFLTKSKDPSLDIVAAFLKRFAHDHGGSIRTDQGGKLARYFALSDLLLCQYGYVVELTGADSPSQNGTVEVYNGKLAIKMRTLVYGSGLTAKYWSSAFLHAVYLHNCLVHDTTKQTPFEGFHQLKPNLSHLNVFGSQVCMKHTGKRHGKLDRHVFKGKFLGYTTTDHNIVYIDLDSGLVNTSHHAQFDEAWYLQTTWPPAVQLLFDLGIEADVATTPDPPQDSEPLQLDAPYPPLPTPPSGDNPWTVPAKCKLLPLPLPRWHSATPPI
jgi:hypothetical protein